MHVLFKLDILLQILVRMGKNVAICLDEIICHLYQITGNPIYR